MSLALSVPGRPCAPRNGLYFRMENDNFKKRFNNHLRMEILGDIAYMVYPRSRPKRAYTLKLTPADDACIIDWTPVDDTWHPGRLQFACAEGVPGLLEDSDRFWKLDQEYSEEYVARRRIELEAQSPLALTDAVARRRIELEAQSPLALTDAVVTGNAAGASNVRPRAPPEWLGEDPGARVHAGPSEEVLPAAASSQRNVRPRIPQEDAQQHPLAHEGSAAESGGRVCVDSARCRSGSP